MRHLTRLSFEWALRCFGADHVMNRKVRALRTAEEAIELCQAEGVLQKQILELTNVVYSRPSGTPRQEMGGILLTAAVNCDAHGWDVESVFIEELGRVLAKPVEHFAQRNQEKIDLGLTGDAGVQNKS